MYCERTQVGAGALSFLEEMSKAASGHDRVDFAAMVATVPDIVKPAHIPAVLPSLAHRGEVQYAVTLADVFEEKIYATSLRDHL
eukprot:COSAG02_NODE_22953_length_734_cov_1.451969_1_plen_83_part_10